MSHEQAFKWENVVKDNKVWKYVRMAWLIQEDTEKSCPQFDCTMKYKNGLELFRHLIDSKETQNGHGKAGSQAIKILEDMWKIKKCDILTENDDRRDINDRKDIDEESLKDMLKSQINTKTNTLEILKMMLTNEKTPGRGKVNSNVSMRKFTEPPIWTK